VPPPEPPDDPATPYLPSQAHDSPLKPEGFELLLEGHPNLAYKAYVLSGVTIGFDLWLASGGGGFVIPNPSSCKLHASYLNKWQRVEAEGGRITGPFTLDALPHPHCELSPLGSVPKRSYTAEVKRRIIHNLSKSPTMGQLLDPALLEMLEDGADLSVNGAVRGNCSVQYVTTEDVANVLKRFGKTAYIAKADVEAAYRNVPTHQRTYHRVMSEWMDKVYYDVRLCFGERAAPAIFTAISDAVRFAVQRRINAAVGNDQVVVLSLLDDFFCIGRNFEVTQLAYELLLEAMDQAGLPYHDDKTIGPNQDVEVLGVQFTLVNNDWLIGLPADKALNLATILDDFGNSTARPTKKEVLSLAGKLGFAHQMWPAARPFVSEMFRIAHNGGYQPSHFCAINQALRDDCSEWLQLLQDPRARRVIGATPPPVADVTMCGDASGLEGFGAWLDSSPVQFFCSTWQDVGPEGEQLLAANKGVSSTLQELFALCVAFITFPVGRGRLFQYYTDNENLLHDFRRGRSSVRVINSLLRWLAMRMTRDGVFFRVGWQRRSHTDQVLADLLSRCKVADFSVASERTVASHPSPIPTSALRDLVDCLRW